MVETFFITGGTDAQGGYVARQLLHAGQAVRAIARNPDSDAARTLAAKGAQIFRGDFDDVASMEHVAQGCVGVFIDVSTVMTDPQGEIRHMNNILEACRKSSTPSSLDMILKISGMLAYR